jgi:hypothetical protein
VLDNDARLDNLDATISSRSTATQGATKAELDAAEAAILGAMPDVSGLAAEDGGRLEALDDRLPAIPASQGDVAGAALAVIEALPAELTAEQVWTYAERTITAGGLTMEQVIQAVFAKAIINKETGIMTVYDPDGNPLVSGTLTLTATEAIWEPA